jgi:hypothetical protein
MLYVGQRQLTSIGFAGSLTVTKKSSVWITVDFGISAPPVALWPSGFLVGVPPEVSSVLCVIGIELPMGLRLDASLELLVQPLDGVGRACTLPLARREACERKQASHRPNGPKVNVRRILLYDVARL